MLWWIHLFYLQTCHFQTFITNNSDIFVEDSGWKKFSRWIVHGVNVINVTGFRKSISDTNVASERKASKTRETLRQVVRLYANRERCVCGSAGHVAYVRSSIGRLLDERYVTRNAYTAESRRGILINLWYRRTGSWSVNVIRRKEIAPRFLLS